MHTPCTTSAKWRTLVGKTPSDWGKPMNTFDAMSRDLAIPSRVPCEWCIDGHTPPTRTNWGAFVSMERDRDGQPTHIVVCSTNGKGHPNDVDADWVAATLRAERGARCVAFTEAHEEGGWCYHPHFKHRAAVSKA